MRTCRGALSRRCLIVATTSLVAVALCGPAAVAKAPTQQGWWTVTNLSRVELPAGVDPGAPLPGAAAPAPPDVPEDGLLVQGGPSDSSDHPGGVGGPTAIAALVYEVPVGQAAEQLVLTVVEGSASTPLAPLRLCPLTNASLRSAQGGPMSDAPEHDCATEVTTEPAEDGSRYEFAVADIAFDGVLAVAILPSEPDDRVVLDAPGDGSLVTAAAAAPTAPSTIEPGENAVGGAVPTRSVPMTRRAPPPGVNVPATRAPAAGGQAAGVPAPAIPGSAPAASAVSVLDEELDGTTAILVVAGLGVAAALWAGAGRGRDTEDEEIGAGLVAPGV